MIRTQLQQEMFSLKWRKVHSTKVPLVPRLFNHSSVSGQNLLRISWRYLQKEKIRILLSHTRVKERSKWKLGAWELVVFSLLVSSISRVWKMGCAFVVY